MPMIGSRAFTRRRLEATTRDSNGYPVAGDTVDPDAEILGVLQDVDFKDLEAQGFGDRDRTYKYFMTETEIRTVEILSGSPADRIIDGDLVYEVQRVAHVEAILPHYEAYLALIQER